MSETPVTRGKFLRALGRSLPGMVMGSGIAAAAQTLAARLAAAGGESSATLMTQLPPAKEIPFFKHGPPEGNRVALTFDDGPTPGVTDRILDELKQRKLSATFFMIGECIAAAPDLARRVLAEGHEIGNHSFTHPKLNTLPDAQVEAELQKTQDLLQQLLNYRPTSFRPPYGAFRQNQAPLAQAKQLRVIFWNVDPADWAQPGEAKIVETIWTQTRAGSIIVCHDKYPQTANCLGQILDGLLERNFHFVRISSLLSQTFSHAK